VKLPNGQIEVASAGVLERGFRCGLLGPRTAVCPVGTRVWTTLAHAAEIESDAEATFPSLSPVAMEDDAPEVVDGAPWRVGSFGEEEPWRNGGRRTIASIFAVAAVVTLFACGVRWATVRGHVAGRAVTAPVAFAAAAPRPAAPEPAASTPPPPARDKEKPFTKAQLRRLRELDAVRRATGWKAKQRAGGGISRTPLVPPRRSEARTVDPFLRGVGAHDPLDGSL